MTLRHSRCMAIVAIALLSTACKRTNESDVAKLRSEVMVLGAKLEAFQESMRSLETDVMKLQLAPDYETASFDPAADQGFFPVHTSIGFFAVSVEDVQSFADGARVRLQIGNLTSATINGAKVKAKWGERVPKDAKRFGEWSKSLQEKEVSIMNGLRPGSWTNFTLTLPGTPPGKLGYLDISMETPQIALALAR